MLYTVFPKCAASDGNFLKITKCTFVRHKARTDQYIYKHRSRQKSFVPVCSFLSPVHCFLPTSARYYILSYHCYSYSTHRPQYAISGFEGRLVLFIAAGRLQDCFILYLLRGWNIASTIPIILSFMFQIAKLMGPTWGPPGFCRPRMGPMLAPWTLLSGVAYEMFRAYGNIFVSTNMVPDYRWFLSWGWSFNNCNSYV